MSSSSLPSSSSNRQDWSLGMSMGDASDIVASAISLIRPPPNQAPSSSTTLLPDLQHSDNRDFAHQLNLLKAWKIPSTLEGLCSIVPHKDVYTAPPIPSHHLTDLDPQYYTTNSHGTPLTPEAISRMIGFTTKLIYAKLPYLLTCLYVNNHIPVINGTPGSGKTLAILLLFCRKHELKSRAGSSSSTSSSTSDLELEIPPVWRSKVIVTLPTTKQVISTATNARLLQEDITGLTSIEAVTGKSRLTSHTPPTVHFTTYPLVLRKLLRLRGSELLALDEADRPDATTQLLLLFAVLGSSIRNRFKLVIMHAAEDIFYPAHLFTTKFLASSKVKFEDFNVSTVGCARRDITLRLLRENQNIVIEQLIHSAEVGRKILIFLPGKPEIEEVVKYLCGNRSQAKSLLMYALVGGQTLLYYINEEETQASSNFASKVVPDDAFEQKFHSTLRMVILSTNVAERAMTISSLHMVINIPYTKQPGQVFAVPSLLTVQASESQMRNRAGRGGRTYHTLVINFSYEEEGDTVPIATSLPLLLEADVSSWLLSLYSLTSSNGLDFFLPELAVISTLSIRTLGTNWYWANMTLCERHLLDVMEVRFSTLSDRLFADLLETALGRRKPRTFLQPRLTSLGEVVQSLPLSIPLAEALICTLVDLPEFRDSPFSRESFPFQLHPQQRNYLDSVASQTTANNDDSAQGEIVSTPAFPVVSDTIHQSAESVMAQDLPPASTTLYFVDEAAPYPCLQVLRLVAFISYLSTNVKTYVSGLVDRLKPHNISSLRRLLDRELPLEYPILTAEKLQKTDQKKPSNCRRILHELFDTTEGLSTAQRDLRLILKKLLAKLHLIKTLQTKDLCPSEFWKNQLALNQWSLRSSDPLSGTPSDDKDNADKALDAMILLWDTLICFHPEHFIIPMVSNNTYVSLTGTVFPAMEELKSNPAYIFSYQSHWQSSTNPFTKRPIWESAFVFCKRPLIWFQGWFVKTSQSGQVRSRRCFSVKKTQPMLGKILPYVTTREIVIWLTDSSELYSLDGNRHHQQWGVTSVMNIIMRNTAAPNQLLIPRIFAKGGLTLSEAALQVLAQAADKGGNMKFPLMILNAQINERIVKSSKVLPLHDSESTNPDSSLYDWMAVVDNAFTVFENNCDRIIYLFAYGRAYPAFEQQATLYDETMEIVLQRVRRFSNAAAIDLTEHLIRAADADPAFFCQDGIHFNLHAESTLAHILDQLLFACPLLNHPLYPLTVPDRMPYPMLPQNASSRRILEMTPMMQGTMRSGGIRVTVNVLPSLVDPLLLHLPSSTSDPKTRWRDHLSYKSYPFYGCTPKGIYCTLCNTLACTLSGSKNAHDMPAATNNSEHYPGQHEHNLSIYYRLLYAKGDKIGFRAYAQEDARVRPKHLEWLRTLFESKCLHPRVRDSLTLTNEEFNELLLQQRHPHNTRDEGCYARPLTSFFDNVIPVYEMLLKVPGTINCRVIYFNALNHQRILQPPALRQGFDLIPYHRLPQSVMTESEFVKYNNSRTEKHKGNSNLDRPRGLTPSCLLPNRQVTLNVIWAPEGKDRSDYVAYTAAHLKSKGFQNIYVMTTPHPSKLTGPTTYKSSVAFAYALYFLFSSSPLSTFTNDTCALTKKELLQFLNFKKERYSQIIFWVDSVRLGPNEDVSSVLHFSHRRGMHILGYAHWPQENRLLRSFGAPGVLLSYEALAFVLHDIVSRMIIGKQRWYIDSFLYDSGQSMVTKSKMASTQEFIFHTLRCAPHCRISTTLGDFNEPITTFGGSVYPSPTDIHGVVNTSDTCPPRILHQVEVLEAHGHIGHRWIRGSVIPPDLRTQMLTVVNEYPPLPEIGLWRIDNLPLSFGQLHDNRTSLRFTGYVEHSDYPLFVTSDVVTTPPLITMAAKAKLMHSGELWDTLKRLYNVPEFTLSSSPVAVASSSSRAIAQPPNTFFQLLASIPGLPELSSYIGSRYTPCEAIVNTKRHLEHDFEDAVYKLTKASAVYLSGKKRRKPIAAVYTEHNPIIIKPGMVPIPGGSLQPVFTSSQGSFNVKGGNWSQDRPIGLYTIKENRRPPCLVPGDQRWLKQTMNYLPNLVCTFHPSPESILRWQPNDKTPVVWCDCKGGCVADLPSILSRHQRFAKKHSYTIWDDATSRYQLKLPHSRFIELCAELMSECCHVAYGLWRHRWQIRNLEGYWMSGIPWVEGEIQELRAWDMNLFDAHWLCYPCHAARAQTHADAMHQAHNWRTRSALQKRYVERVERYQQRRRLNEAGDAVHICNFSELDEMRNRLKLFCAKYQPFYMQLPGQGECTRIYNEEPPEKPNYGFAKYLYLCRQRNKSSSSQGIPHWSPAQKEIHPPSGKKDM